LSHSLGTFSNSISASLQWAPFFYRIWARVRGRRWRPAFPKSTYMTPSLAPAYFGLLN
jgi:hypothetical protein